MHITNSYFESIHSEPSLWQQKIENVHNTFQNYSSCPSNSKSLFLFLFLFSTSSDSKAVARIYPRAKRGEIAKSIWKIKQKGVKLTWDRLRCNALCQNATKTVDRKFVASAKCGQGRRRRWEYRKNPHDGVTWPQRIVYSIHFFHSTQNVL